ncbi:universal stress protein [Actinotalea sp.]|uniref:universal stress protein n=1 Tax=Actinotalea sp. TaxID=1872145 RepID=UPI00356AE067
MATVLAAVDASPVAPEVMRAAVVFAGLLQASPTALHVGTGTVAGLEVAASSAGLRLDVLDGDPADVIARAMAGAEVALGVIGATGAGSCERPMGRIATALMSSVQRPLVVVPVGSFPPGRRSLRRALLPLDGGPESTAAVEPATELLGGAGVDLVVLHVIDVSSVPVFWDHGSHSAGAWRGEFLAEHLRGRRLRLELRRGDPGQVIAAAAAAENAELVVMGWSRDLSPGHALTVQHTIERLCLPVLLFPVHSALSPAAYREHWRVPADRG